MIKLGIALTTYNRPKYLYVTLSGISKLKIPRNVEVSLYIYNDFLPKNDLILKQQIEVVESFNETCGTLQKFTVRDKKFGATNNITFSIKNTFDEGVDEIIFMEDDVLIRADTLMYAYACTEGHFIRIKDSSEQVQCYNHPLPRDAFFYNFFSRVAVLEVLYRSYINLVERKKFEESRIFNYIVQEEYVGLRNTRDTANLELKSGCDGIFDRFMVDNNLLTRFSNKFYAAHFGVRGLHYDKSIEKFTDEMEKRMFRGRKEEWMNNVIDIFSSSNYPKEIDRSFKPRDFRYRDPK